MKDHGDDGSIGLIPLIWIQIGALLTGLIASVGLFLLLTQSSIAAEKPGLRRGGKSFSGNPFSNLRRGSLSAAEDEEEDDDDEEGDEIDEIMSIPTRDNPNPPSKAENRRQRLAEQRREQRERQRERRQPKRKPRRISVGGKVDPSTEPPEPVRTQKGIKVGGKLRGGVVEHGEVDPILVNTETGIGSNEVITDFNFPDAHVMDIAKTLGKLTGKNFILDKEVMKGRITIISNAPITVGDAWKAFLTALDINGYTLIPSGRFIRISRQREARDKQIKTYLGDFAPNTDALITRVIKLKHISAEEIHHVLRSFMPATSRIIPHAQTNTLIATDTGANLNKLANIIDFLDVEGFDAGIEVIPVKYASATEIAKLIDTLLPGTPARGTSSRRSGRARTARRSGGTFSARRVKGGGVINTIIADERTNKLIVHANTTGANKVRELVIKLDQRRPAQAGGGKIHVVYLQYADAEKIAKTLSGLGAGGSSSRTSRRGRRGAGTGDNPLGTSLFEGAIKVSADVATNSLVITASLGDFVTIQRVLEKLDIPRDEVYVEAVIMEMNMAKNFNFSSNVINPSSGIGFNTSDDLFNFIQNPLSGRGATLGFKAFGERTVEVGGQSFSVGNVQGLINILQTNSLGNVLATPQILTLDNTEAMFETVEKLPVLNSTAVQGAGVTQSVNYQDVRLSIKIKPQINKLSNFVKLDVETKLTDVSNRELPAQVAGSAVATIERNSKTNVAVADGDTVVLGGMVRDRQDETVSKVPLLGDIPLLGWLFRSTKKEMTKTNLLIFLTPHIIRQYEKIRKILDQKLADRDRFIEESNGGDDPLRHYRDEMIRRLPARAKLKDLLKPPSEKARKKAAEGELLKLSDEEEEENKTSKGDQKIPEVPPVEEVSYAPDQDQAAKPVSSSAQSNSGASPAP